MPDQLASIVVDILGDDSALRSKMNESVNFAKGAGGRVGSAFALGFNNPILNAVGAVSQLQAGLTGTISLATTLSGMQVAADFGVFRRQLLGIAGDAKKASDAFQGLQQIANTSNFDADQIMNFGVRQAGRTGDVGDAVRQTQKLVDAAAAFGVQNKDFDMFQFNAAQIQNQGGGKARVEDIRQFQNYAPLATKRIADALGISVTEASKRLQNSTGNQFVDLLTKVGEKNKGAAAAAAGADPFAVSANILDSFKTGIEPTGRLFNAAIMPVVGGIQSLVNFLGRLNAATGGFAGVIGIVGGGIAAFRYFSGTVGAAISATRQLSTALVGLAEAETIARGGAVRGTVGGGIGAVSGAANGISGAMANGEQMVAFVPVQNTDAAHNREGKALRSVGLGWFVDWADKVKNGGAGGATDAHTKAMQEHAEALKTSSKVIGGGDRARISASSFEREYAVYHLMHGNAAGVG